MRVRERVSFFAPPKLLLNVCIERRLRVVLNCAKWSCWWCLQRVTQLMQTTRMQNILFIFSAQRETKEKFLFEETSMRNIFWSRSERNVWKVFERRRHWLIVPAPKVLFFHHRIFWLMKKTIPNEECLESRKRKEEEKETLSLKWISFKRHELEDNESQVGQKQFSYKERFGRSLNKMMNRTAWNSVFVS